MGAVVRGAGTSRIEVEGVDELRPARHTVVPDRVVAATYLAAVGMAGGEVTLADARPDHMEMLLRKLGQMGVATEMGPEGLRADRGRAPAAADVATLPYPGVATDYSPLLVAMLTVADGVGILTENLFSGRFRYVEELRRMGADIRTEGHHAVVRGVPRLSGAPVRAPDIRAGVALVLAGLVAEGRRWSAAPTTSTAATRTWPGALRSLGRPGVVLVSGRPATADPARAARAARAGRPGGARPAALVRRAGRRDRAGGGAAGLPRRACPTPSG